MRETNGNAFVVSYQTEKEEMFVAISETLPFDLRNICKFIEGIYGFKGGGSRTFIQIKVPKEKKEEIKKLLIAICKLFVNTIEIINMIGDDIVVMSNVMKGGNDVIVAPNISRGEDND